MDRVPKCLKAVMFPGAFEAFRGIDDPGAFETAWRSNRPSVLANMAHAAYFESARVAQLMKRLGAATTHWFDHHDTQAFLAVWSDKAILAFRGTEVNAPGDLLADINVLKVAGAIVHRGFWQKLETLWDPHILARLDALETQVADHVSVTGHSLGGAMATLAALRWPFREAVTFGEPRVGLGIGARLRSRRHLRYVNGGDLVPRMPPMIMGYEDHGEIIHLVDPDGANPVYDHSIVYYAELLEMGQGAAAGD